MCTRVAFPERFAPFSLLPPVIPANEPDLQEPRNGTADAPQFPGFDAKDIPALAFMATLLRRNQVLNLTEGLLATLLLATSFGHANSFDVSERVLYIVCCLSNAVCLRCVVIDNCEDILYSYDLLPVAWREACTCQ